MVEKLGAGAGICGNSGLSSQLCHEPKTVLRNIFFKSWITFIIRKNTVFYLNCRVLRTRSVSKISDSRYNEDPFVTERQARAHALANCSSRKQDWVFCLVGYCPEGRGHVLFGEQGGDRKPVPFLSIWQTLEDTKMRKSVRITLQQHSGRSPWLAACPVCSLWKQSYEPNCTFLSPPQGEGLFTSALFETNEGGQAPLAPHCPTESLAAPLGDGEPGTEHRLLSGPDGQTRRSAAETHMARCLSRCQDKHKLKIRSWTPLTEVREVSSLFLAENLP